MSTCTTTSPWSPPVPTTVVGPVGSRRHGAVPLAALLAVVLVVAFVAGPCGPHPRSHRIADDTGTLSLSVPSSWVEVDGAPMLAGLQALSVAPSLALFRTTWGSEGVWAHLVSGTASAALVNYSATCTLQSTRTEGALFWRVWSDCGGLPYSMVEVVGPIDGRNVYLQAELRDDHLDMAAVIVASLRVR